jgi:hypothetical protein
LFQKSQTGLATAKMLIWVGVWPEFFNMHGCFLLLSLISRQPDWGGILGSQIQGTTGDAHLCFQFAENPKNHVFH